MNAKNIKVSDIEVHQTADLLMSQTKGADLNFNQLENVDLGQINIQQRSPLMRNVTGLRINLGPNGGEINVRDHVVVEQENNSGSVRVEINGHLPTAKVTLNKKKTTP